MGIKKTRKFKDVCDFIDEFKKFKEFFESNRGLLYYSITGGRNPVLIDKFEHCREELLLKFGRSLDDLKGPGKASEELFDGITYVLHADKAFLENSYSKSAQKFEEKLDGVTRSLIIFKGFFEKIEKDGFREPEKAPKSSPPYSDLEDLIGAVQLLERLNLKSEWAIAAVYLCAMEVAVNKKFEELGVKSGGDGFEKRWDRLRTAIKDKEGRTIKGGVLTATFWDARNKVVHGGKSPTPHDLELIKKHVSNIVRKIFIKK